MRRILRKATSNFYKSKLLNFRFADNILLLARTESETILLLEILMEKLACVGLSLNAGKAVVLTNEVQPPECLILTYPEAIVVKGWGIFCPLVPLEGQLWTSIIAYRQPQGRSLPTNSFSVIERFVLQFGSGFLSRVITPVTLFASASKHPPTNSAGKMFNPSTPFLHGPLKTLYRH